MLKWLKFSINRKRKDSNKSPLILSNLNLNPIIKMIYVVCDADCGCWIAMTAVVKRLHMTVVWVMRLVVTSNNSNIQTQVNVDNANGFQNIFLICLFQLIWMQCKTICIWIVFINQPTKLDFNSISVELNQQYCSRLCKRFMLISLIPN